MNSLSKHVKIRRAKEATHGVVNCYKDMIFFQKDPFIQKMKPYVMLWVKTMTSVVVPSDCLTYGSCHKQTIIQFIVTLHKEDII